MRDIYKVISSVQVNKKKLAIKVFKTSKMQCPKDEMSGQHPLAN